jgi:type I restriction enzyme, S subunit
MSEAKILPATWAEVSIETVLQPLEDSRLLHHGWSPQCEKVPSLSDSDWGVLKTTAIQDGLFLSEHNKRLPKTLKPRPQLEVKSGDILITCAGPRNRCGVPCLVRYTRPRLILSGKMYRFRVRECLMHAAFMEAYLREKNTQAAIDKMKTGISDSGLNLTHGRFLRLTVPFPPPNEQRRIVAKIEELFSDLDAGVAALERAKANLKRYRASVLKAAVDGSLTAEWRAKHPKVEPASKLLERILVERRRKWEVDQLAKFKATGKEPPKNWRAKYVEPSPPDTTDLPKLPGDWCWTKLDAVADVVGGITKDQKRPKLPGMREVPYLRVANVQRGFLDLSEMKEITATEEDIAALSLEPDDMLFTEGGDRDKLGRGWVWSGELPECIHQNHIFRARLFLKELQPRLISHHANSFGQAWFVKAGKQTTNLASINLGILRRFPIPVPSAEEQREIISQVDERLSEIEAAEVAIGHSLLRASRLRQSILKEAFEGKLVPQDPKDEPASVLLERIKTESQRHDANGKPTRTKPWKAKQKSS